MKPICLSLLAVALSAAASAQAPPAADGGEKKVRLVWFPRFSPDGSQVLTAHGSWDKKEGGEARLFAAKDGKVEHVFPHPRGVRTVAWAPKGTTFVTGGYGQGIRGFDVKTRKELFLVAGTQNVENLRVTSDDKLVCASFGNGSVRLYDLASRKEVHAFPAVHDGGIWGMALSPDDQLLVTGGKDTFANVLDLGTRKKVHALKHPGEVNGLAFTPDGRLLATGCTDTRIRIFDVATGERVAMVKAHDGGPVTDLQFTSDGKLLASAAGDGTVRVWDMTDLKNPTQKMLLKVTENSMAFGVAISPDNSRLAAVSWDEQVKVWDLKTGQIVWAWKR
jgi:WD40 repeat protein